MASWLKQVFVATSVATAMAAGSAGAMLAASSTPGYDRALEGSLFFRVPEGFLGIQQEGGVLLYPAAIPSGDSVLVLAREVAVEPSLRGAEAETKRAAWAASIVTAVASALIDDPKPVVREEPAPAPPRGAPVEVRSFSIASRRGRLLVPRMRARTLFDGAALHLMLATRPGHEASSLLDAGYESLYASLGFARLGDRAPRRLAPPLPSTLPSGDSSPVAGRPPESGGRPAAPQCRVVQRQQCSGGIGTSLGYFCTTVPQRVCS